MNNNIEDAVRNALTKKRTRNQLDDIHNMELYRGKRPKRIIEANKTNYNYYQTQNIHKPLLDHYVNVDWFQRDDTYDLV